MQLSWQWGDMIIFPVFLQSGRAKTLVAPSVRAPGCCRRGPDTCASASAKWMLPTSCYERVGRPSHPPAALASSAGEQPKGAEWIWLAACSLACLSAHILASGSTWPDRWVGNPRGGGEAAGQRRCPSWHTTRQGKRGRGPDLIALTHHAQLLQ